MKRIAIFSESTVIVSTLLSCSAPKAYFDASRRRHTREGFRNNYSHDTKGSVWAWQWERWREDLPRKPAGGNRFEVLRKEAANLLNPSVAWIGHATVLLRVSRLNVLADPQFSERASPVSFAGPKRVVPLLSRLMNYRISMRRSSPTVISIISTHRAWRRSRSSPAVRLCCTRGRGSKNGSRIYLRIENFVGMGTFNNLTDESLHDPPQRLAQALEARILPVDAFCVLQHGETRVIEQRP